MTRLLLAAAMLLVFDAARAQGAPCAQGQGTDAAPRASVLAQAHAQAVVDEDLLDSPFGACETVAANGDGATRRRSRTAAPSHRFDMTQNGKRMSAADFDKWMKARGIRVATGKPAKPKPKR
jgi:hypothetical protein